MQLQLTTIHVEDLEESVAFYKSIVGTEEVKCINPCPVETSNRVEVELIKKFKLRADN